MLLLRVVLYMLVRNASPRGTMCFRCLISSLSGHCELLFLFFYCFVCCLFDNACELFGETIRNMYGCVCY